MFIRISSLAAELIGIIIIPVALGVLLLFTALGLILGTL